VDFSDTTLEEIGDEVLVSGRRIREVKFPRTLRRAGSCLLADSTSLRMLDLRGTALEYIRYGLLLHSGVENVFFPDTLSILGICALCYTSLLELDLSNTKLTRLDFFLTGSNKVHCLVLPPTLIQLGDSSIRYFATLVPGFSFVPDLSKGGALVHLDLCHTQIKEIGRLSLYGAVNLQTLRLPATLERVGECFLPRADQLHSLDLSGTRLTELPSRFGLLSGLEELQLPATLQVIGDRVLQRTKLTRLDLSHTSVARIGVRFGLGSPLKSLLYLVAVRPYHDRLEQWLAVIGALLTLALNCLCLVTTLCEEAPTKERLLDVLSIFSVVEMSYFFLQALLLAIAALAELHRRRLQQQWQNNSSEQHNSSVEEGPVLKPPARTFNDERNLTELQNPLLSP
jgi:hypothetical protein